MDKKRRWPALDQIGQMSVPSPSAAGRVGRATAKSCSESAVSTGTRTWGTTESRADWGHLTAMIPSATRTET
eukprot:3061340-Lingulodinium_polyedra.AAC.1